MCHNLMSMYDGVKAASFHLQVKALGAGAFAHVELCKLDGEKEVRQKSAVWALIACSVHDVLPSIHSRSQIHTAGLRLLSLRHVKTMRSGAVTLAVAAGAAGGGEDAEGGAVQQPDGPGGLCEGGRTAGIAVPPVSFVEPAELDALR